MSTTVWSVVGVGAAAVVAAVLLLTGGEPGSPGPGSGGAGSATGSSTTGSSTTGTSTTGSSTGGSPGAQPDGTPFRAFSADSWWNTEVPADAPSHPDAARILDYMSTAEEAGGGCISLAGAENSWGQPVYWAGEGDEEWDVNVPKVDEPPELSSLRLPAGAQAADTSDEAMTVFDLEKGYVVALTGAHFNDERGVWRADGATVTYLDSNGLDARAEGSDDERNLGTHRGNNGATMMVRHDEVVAGRVRHVVKVASGPELSTRAVWPMVGSDGDSRDPLAPEQGLRFRLKPSVDLDALDLHPEARVIAEGLQAYGFYLGDSAGTTALKLENTTAQGEGQKWTVQQEALCDLPLGTELWDVLPAGYDPTQP